MFRGHLFRGYQLLPGHFSIDILGKKYIYVYIRKNACTAFKYMFISESSRKDKFSGDYPLKFMRKYHKTRIRDFENEAEKTIVVIRDPYRRLISLYLNKFVQCSGNDDIFSNYKHLTGRDPTEASFREFLTEYVTHHPISHLDCHLRPQVQHLYPGVYTAPIRFEFLHQDMCRVIGNTYADKYFKRKVNVSSDYNVLDIADSPDIPARSLADMYASEGMLPDIDGFYCDELKSAIESVYLSDLHVYQDLNSNYADLRGDKTPKLDVRKYL